MEQEGNALAMAAPVDPKQSWMDTLRGVLFGESRDAPEAVAARAQKYADRQNVVGASDARAIDAGQTVAALGGKVVNQLLLPQEDQPDVVSKVQPEDSGWTVGGKVLGHFVEGAGDLLTSPYRHFAQGWAAAEKGDDVGTASHATEAVGNLLALSGGLNPAAMLRRDPNQLNVFIGRTGAQRLQEAGAGDYLNRMEMGAVAESQGKTPQQIWNDHGVFRDKDGVMKAEIRDPSAVQIPPQYSDFNHKKQQVLNLPYFSTSNTADNTLAALYPHPELYTAYPKLAEVPLKAVPALAAMNGVRGAVSDPAVGKQVLYLGRLTSEELPNLMAHEVEHLVQDFEGHAPGGNTRQFLDPNIVEYNKKLLEREKELNAQNIQNLKDVLPEGDEGIKEYDKLKLGYDVSQDLLEQFKKEKAPYLVETFEEKLAEHPFNKYLDPAVLDEMRVLKANKSVYRDHLDDNFNKYEGLKGEVAARNAGASAENPEYYKLHPFDRPDYWKGPQTGEAENWALHPVEHDPFDLDSERKVRK